MSYQQLLHVLEKDSISYDEITGQIRHLVESEHDLDALRRIASDRSREQLHVFVWLIENFIERDEFIETAIPILQGLIPNYTICSHCEFDVSISLMLQLAQIYELLGDFDNAALAYQHVITEIGAAKHLARKGGGGEHLVKIHMIKNLEGRAWMVEQKDGSGVIVVPGLGNRREILIGNPEPDGLMLAESGTLTLLNSQLSMTYAGLAKLHNLARDFQTAQELLLEARRIDETIEDWASLGATCNDLGNFTREQGFPVASREYYAEAMEAHKNAGNTKGVANAMTNLGLSFADPSQRQAFDPTQGLRYLLESIPMHMQVGNTQSQLNAILGIVTITDFARGTASLDPILPDEPLDNLPPDAAALVKANLQSVNHALRILKDIPLEYIADRGYNGFERMSWHDTASAILFNQGMHDAVLREVGAYCARFSEIFPSTTTSHETQMGLLDDCYEVLGRGIRSALILYRKRGDHEILRVLANLIERTKARNLIRSLYFRTDSNVSQQWDLVQETQRSTESAAGAVKAAPRNFRDRETLIRNLVDMTQAVDGMQASRYFSRSFPPLEDDLTRQFESHVQSHTRSWVLVDLIILHGEVLALILDHQGIQLEHLNLTPEKITGITGSSLLSRQDLDSQVLTMRQAFSGPAWERLNQATELFVIPHGDLHLVSWEHVFAGKVVTRAYSMDLAIHGFDNGYLPTSRVGLVVCPDTALSPVTAKEADFVTGVMKQMGLRPVQLTGSAATKDRVLRELETAKVAHIVCHASFDLHDPMSSFVSLSDGVLTANEIAGLKGGPKLLFLNACKAGQTQRVPPVRYQVRADEELGAVFISAKSAADTTVVYDEQFGLVSSLFSLGVNSVIVTTRSILDTDSLAASHCIYTELLNGKAIGIAMKKLYEPQKSLSLGVAVHALFGNPFSTVP